MHRFVYEVLFYWTMCLAVYLIDEFYIIPSGIWPFRGLFPAFNFFFTMIIFFIVPILEKQTDAEKKQSFIAMSLIALFLTVIGNIYKGWYPFDYIYRTTIMNIPVHVIHDVGRHLAFDCIIRRAWSFIEKLLFKEPDPVQVAAN